MGDPCHERRGYSDGYQEVLVEDGETVFAGSSSPRATARFRKRAGSPVPSSTIPGPCRRRDRSDGRRMGVGRRGELELELEHGRHRIVTNVAGYERVAGDVQVKFVGRRN
ncbi:hypothetical protein [Natrinema sp. SYSU A 869]|uniref:hypothetical protein n=1 Tax=Natrinema sp. SYSU A 869 TaxID=2871694 RepID=UPI001CA40027|nr:hypothetical protein [Natrinema sp. SYSU A 869]